MPEPPLSFRLAKTLVRHHVRGGSRLANFMRGRGWFDQPVLFQLAPGVSIEVPIGRPDSFMDEYDLLDYEQPLMDVLHEAVSRLPGPVVMVDCGADIGIFSLKAIAANPNIQAVHSFEPGPVAFPMLERSIKRLSISATAHRMAVADYDGQGELSSPAYDSSDHARYLVPTPDGSIRVTTVDHLGLPSAPSLLLKLDLEGGEPAALRGSAESIRRFANVVVVVEAHPKVAKRRSTDPCEMLRFLSSLRRFRFLVAEAPDTRVDQSRPFFSQVDPTAVHNIVAISE